MIVIDTSHPIVCYLLKKNYLVTTSAMFLSNIDKVYFNALDTNYLSAISIKRCLKKIKEITPAGIHLSLQLATKYM